ncbi:unnamed protein product, partial [Bubo scandiacus]
MDDDDEDEDEDGDGDPDAPPAPAAPLLLTSASSTSASHCWPQPPPTSTAEKWASESASRVMSGNSAKAARQQLQGFGTSHGNEHMQAVRHKTTEPPTSSLAQTNHPLKIFLPARSVLSPKA